MNEKRCGSCGGYLPARPFNFIDRSVGTLMYFKCPNCGQVVKEWVSKNGKNEK